MKISNPFRARVVAEIDIYAALSAVEYFAANIPTERISSEIYDRLLKSVAVMIERTVETPQPTGGCVEAPVRGAEYPYCGPPHIMLFDKDGPPHLVPDCLVRVPCDHPEPCGYVHWAHKTDKPCIHGKANLASYPPPLISAHRTRRSR